MEPQYEVRRNPVILPQEPQNEQESSEIGIIKGLQIADAEIDYLVNRLSGKAKNDDDEWVVVCRPIMNPEGLNNLRQTLSAISHKIITMGFMDKEQINVIFKFYYNKNVAHFQTYSEDFGLNEYNYNVVENWLFSMIFGSLSKARGAGDRNVIRGVYSEDTVAKMYAGQQGQPMMYEQPREKRGWNPFRRRR
jgi:hypothetical protein